MWWEIVDLWRPVAQSPAPQGCHSPSARLLSIANRCGSLGFDTAALVTEGQVALLPAAHELATRRSLVLADVTDVPDLPIARWPRLDGTYPDGPGPEVRTQAQLAQLVALGRTLLVIPASSRAWQWPDHVAVPVVDAPEVTTALAWHPERRTPALDAFLSAVVGGSAGTTAPAEADVG